MLDSNQQKPVIVEYLMAIREEGSQASSCALIVFAAYVILAAVAILPLALVIKMIGADPLWALAGPFLSLAVPSFALGFYLYHSAVSSESRRRIIQRMFFYPQILILIESFIAKSVLFRHQQVGFGVDVLRGVVIVVSLFVFAVVLPFLVGKSIRLRTSDPSGLIQ